MPLTFTVASIIGPMLGGFLAEPAKNFPDYFDNDGLFGRYPFLLPNLICAVLFAIAAVFGLFFIEETLWTKKSQPDPFLKIGHKISSWVFRSDSGNNGKLTDENTPLLHNAPASRTVDEETLYKERMAYKQPTLRDALTKQSALNIIVYMLLALHVTYDSLFPVLLSAPPAEPGTQSPPFMFAGGFGLESADIGKIFSFYGVLCMLVQFFIFPPMAVKYGALRCLRFVAPIFPISYLLAPYTVLIPSLSLGLKVLIGITLIKKFGEVFAFPSSTIMVTNSSPSLRVLGTLNGIVTASGALARAIGPTVGGTLFTYGVKHNFILLPYITLALVTSTGAFFLKDIVEMDGPAQRDAALLATEQSEEEDVQRPTSNTL